MTNDELRMKSEARMSKDSQWCVRRFRHSDFVIPSDFVLRHSDLRIAVCSIKRPVRGLVRAGAGGSVHGTPLSFDAVHWDHEPSDRAVASWTAPVVRGWVGSWIATQ